VAHDARQVHRARYGLPGNGRTTVTWYFDGQMDRAENYETMELALARADHIHGILLRDGWTDVGEPRP
jgi:hypothetical protein